MELMLEVVEKSEDVESRNEAYHAQHANDEEERGQVVGGDQPKQAPSAWGCAAVKAVSMFQPVRVAYQSAHAPVPPSRVDAKRTVAQQGT